VQQKLSGFGWWLCVWKARKAVVDWSYGDKLRVFLIGPGERLSLLCPEISMHCIAATKYLYASFPESTCISCTDIYTLYNSEQPNWVATAEMYRAAGWKFSPGAGSRYTPDVSTCFFTNSSIKVEWSRSICFEQSVMLAVRLLEKICWAHNPNITRMRLWNTIFSPVSCWLVC